MSQMDFETIGADAYALVDLETGAVVSSVLTRESVFECLDAARQEEPSRLEMLQVVAVDLKGHPIAHWLPSSLLADA
jgi:hypothetical protein